MGCPVEGKTGGQQGRRQHQPEPNNGDKDKISFHEEREKCEEGKNDTKSGSMHDPLFVEGYRPISIISMALANHYRNEKSNILCILLLLVVK